MIELWWFKDICDAMCTGDYGVLGPACGGWPVLTLSLRLVQAAPALAERASALSAVPS